MDSCCTVDFSHDALQSGDSNRIAATGILVDDSPSIIRTTDSVLCWTDQSCSENQSGQIVSTLARILTPLLGNEALDATYALIGRFGTIARLLDASPEAIRLCLPSNEAAVQKILAARELSRVGWHEVLCGKPVDVGCRTLHAYLRACLQTTAEERIHAIFLDANGVYIRDEFLSRGQVDNAALDLRKLAHRAFDFQARQLILSHNHPSGHCKPSAQDEITTTKIRDVLAALAIELRDHLILASGQVYSMRRGGLI